MAWPAAAYGGNESISYSGVLVCASVMARVRTRLYHRTAGQANCCDAIANPEILDTIVDDRQRMDVIENINECIA